MSGGRPDQACVRFDLRRREIRAERAFLEGHDLHGHALQQRKEEVATRAAGEGYAEQRELQAMGGIAETAQHVDELPFSAAASQRRADGDDAPRHRQVR